MDSSNNNGTEKRTVPDALMITGFFEFLTTKKQLSRGSIKNYRTHLIEFAAFLDGTDRARRNHDVRTVLSNPSLDPKLRSLSKKKVRNFVTHLDKQKYDEQRVSERLATLRSLIEFLAETGCVSIKLVEAVPRRSLRLPAGYRWPEEIHAKYPKLQKQTLITWYRYCPPLHRKIRMWPKRPNRKQKRGVFEADVVLALRWYRDELPDEFTDELLGDLIVLQKAAILLKRDVSTVRWWAKGCPRLGPDPKDPSKNQKLDLFHFFMFGTDRTHLKGRLYIRKEKIGEINRFAGDPPKPSTLSHTELKHIRGGNNPRITRFFNRSRTLPSLAHPANRMIANATIQRVAMMNSRGHEITPRKTRYDEASARRAADYLYNSADDGWKRQGRLLKDHPTCRSAARSRQHLVEAEAAGRVSIRLRDIPGSEKKWKEYNVAEWKNLALKLRRVKDDERTIERDGYKWIPELDAARKIGVLFVKLFATATRFLSVDELKSFRRQYANDAVGFAKEGYWHCRADLVQTIARRQKGEPDAMEEASSSPATADAKKVKRNRGRPRLTPAERADRLTLLDLWQEAHRQGFLLEAFCRTRVYHGRQLTVPIFKAIQSWRAGDRDRRAKRA